MDSQIIPSALGASTQMSPLLTFAQIDRIRPLGRVLTGRLKTIAPEVVALLISSVLVAAAPSPADDLYNAIRTNDLARLRSLVRTAAEANARYEHGATPLMFAAAAGSLDAM